MSASAAIIRLKRKRNEDPLPTLYLGIDSTTNTSSPTDTIKRTKLEHTHPSIFALALTVDSEEYTSLETIDIQQLYKSTVESRPTSSDSETSKKRSFSNLVDPPKFRMSRKKPRQHPPSSTISQDYIIFDAEREVEPIQREIEGVPIIQPSGIPDEIQKGDSLAPPLHEMLREYLTVDHENRTYVNLKTEYVYDIYYRMAVSPDTVPKDANFGVLVYDSDPELLEDEEENVYDEDADSNSEGYYQNSYPDEDEWAGEGWGSEEEEDEYGRRRERRVFDSDEDIGRESEDESYSYPETD